LEILIWLQKIKAGPDDRIVLSQDYRHVSVIEITHVLGYLLLHKKGNIGSITSKQSIYVNKRFEHQ
jgi:hypothetical protein